MSLPLAPEAGVARFQPPAAEPEGAGGGGGGGGGVEGGVGGEGRCAQAWRRFDICKYGDLVNLAFSFLVISPFIVLYWRGTWNLLTYYTYNLGTVYTCSTSTEESARSSCFYSSWLI